MDASRSFPSAARRLIYSVRLGSNKSSTQDEKLFVSADTRTQRPPYRISLSLLIEELRSYLGPTGQKMKYSVK